MFKRWFAWAGILALLAVLAAQAGTATAAAPASCNTSGLTYTTTGAKKNTFRVVSIRAQGVACTAARKVATEVVQDLAHGRTISIAGATGFGMSQSTCSGAGCGGTSTTVSITYPRGTVVVSVRSGANSTTTTSPGGPTTVI